MLTSLQAFLVLYYTDVELRELVRNVFDDPWMSSSLPGAGASVQDLAQRIVLLLQQSYPTPPRKLWDHLYSTRPQRGAEIDAIAASFDPRPITGESTVPAPEQSSARLRLNEGPEGKHDLLDTLSVLRSQSASSLPGFLTTLTPGTVNGLSRVLRLAWTPRSLTIQATPSLFRDNDPMPNRLDMATPVPPTELRYFPNGRHFYREGRPPPQIRLNVDAWSGRDRCLTLTDPADGQRFSLEFPLSERQLNR